MSYPTDLDEYSEQVLQGELERREKARAKGLCDYCNQRADTPPCKFPERHKVVPRNEKTLDRLAKWLQDHPVEFHTLAWKTHLPLPTCEGVVGACDGKVLFYTQTRTAYEGEDPLRLLSLCPECSEVYHEEWDARWREYEAGLL